MKYKHSASKRYLASLTGDDVVVHRIEGSFKDEKVFASGMDSTILFIKLYDRDGQLLTEVDPSDLTLSTSEDVEAKPFVFKQGVYKAEILPRVKSKSIRMKVDWFERVASPEIVLKTTITPFKDELDLIKTNYQKPHLGGLYGRPPSLIPTGGFSFDNNGDNRIVDAARNPESERYFDFDYLEMARQNLAMEVYDAPNGTVSHTMHSIFMFFPRKNLFLYEELTGTIDVTLPTGEKMIFQKESKEVVDGVFTEGPLDNSTDRTKRKYPDLKYQGKGVVIRANARGQSPQLGQFEKIKIDNQFGVMGSAEVLVINGTTGQRCIRPKADFWEPIDVSPIEFKFPTDEGLDKYLKEKCGFGLPKI